MDSVETLLDGLQWLWLRKGRLVALALVAVVVLFLLWHLSPPRFPMNF